MQSTKAETTTIEREVAIAAPPETVWSFLVDPEKAARWMGAAVSLDPRPGGLYRVEVLPGQVARGEFVELDPPWRIVWTWGWERDASDPLPAGTSTIEIELVPGGRGTTTLRFRHLGLPDRASTDAHAHGWDHYLARLAAAAGGSDPGRDPWLA